ncbi:hypothetical protein [Gordonia humi]|uniref:Uncharacterized protein n=1 Tax=Gordonia humi TaxID=686429 RepID=A0A840F8E3_9ACTN|nr:hypothetical protein [Gordonia humi]MBB4138156.1 hypothetical protein [Gordonia humi]
MTEDVETAGGGVIDRKSNRGRRRRPVSNCIAIVRPPGGPTAIRVVVSDELGQAQWFPITSQFSTTENEGG